MKIRLTAIGAALALGISLQAGTTFDYTQGATIAESATSTIPNQSIGGISTTLVTDVWANYSNTGSTVVEQSITGATTNFRTDGWIGDYNGNGLAVCNKSEQTACGSPSHQIDNYSGLDFVLFAFNSAVSLNSIQIANYGIPGSSTNGTGGLSGTQSTEDMDLSYALLSFNQEQALLGGTLAFNTNLFTTVSVSGVSGTTAKTVNLTGITQYLLVGTAVTANSGGDNLVDAFKIQNLIVTATPEPASFLLIGSGLLAGALFGRKRILAKSTVKATN